MVSFKCDFCNKSVDRYTTLYHLQDVTRGLSRYTGLDICSECLDSLFKESEEVDDRKDEWSR